MKVNENLLIYTVIGELGNEDGWQINSNIGKNGHYMPFIQNKSIDFYADADNWLIKLYENLKELIKPKENRDIEKFIKALYFEKEEITEIPEEDYQTIVDLIEQAIELGFFKEYYDKSK